MHLETDPLVHLYPLAKTDSLFLEKKKKTWQNIFLFSDVLILDSVFFHNFLNKTAS